MPAGSYRHRNARILRGCFTVVGAVVVLGIVVYLVSKLLPAFSIDVSLQSTLLPSTMGQLVSESKERIEYVVFLGLLIPVILIFDQLSMRVIREGVDGRTTLFVVALLLALVVIYTGFSLKMSQFIYVRYTFAFNHVLLFIFFVLPLTAIVTFGRRLRIVDWILGLLLIICFCVIFIVNVFSSATVGAYVYHLNPVLFPVSQVVAGKDIFVNVGSLYGLYPYFLLPIFSVVPLTVFSLSTVFALLQVASYVFLYMGLRSITKSPVVAVLGVIGAIFLPYLGIKLFGSDVRPEPYFQYTPIRMLFPCIVFFLVCRRKTSESWRGTLLLSIVASLAVFWNSDSGLVVYIASGVCLLLMCPDANKATRLKVGLKRAAVHLFALAGIGLLFCLFVFSRSGEFPHWSQVLEGQLPFVSGYMMLPMPHLPHFWGLVLLVFIVGIATSLPWLFNVRWKTTQGALLFLSLVGLGLFVYFLGRSHESNLFGFEYVPLLMTTIWVDRLVHVERQRWNLAVLSLAVVCLVPLAVSMPSTLALLEDSRFFHWIQEFKASVKHHDDEPIVQSVDFIRSNVHAGESVLILARNLEGIYYAESRTKSAADVPSSTDVFSFKQAQAFEHFLVTNREYKVFYQRKDPGKGYLETVDIDGILSSNYTLVATSAGSLVGLYLPNNLIFGDQ